MSSTADLLVQTGPDAGRLFELAPGDVLTVGRHSQNAIAMTDPRVSRRHCELNYDGKAWMLRDLGSGNGTSVNGRSIDVHALRHGDGIALGDSTLLFRDRREPSDGTRVVWQLEAGSSRAVVSTLAADEPSRIFPLTAVGDAAPSPLAVLYEASTLLSTEPQLDAALVRLLDLLLRSTGAERGCLLVRDPETKQLLPTAVRSRIDGDDLPVSRTIAEAVLRDESALLLADASADSRYRDGASIVQHRLRHVLCAPLKGRHEALGVLFLVHATKAFGEAQLKLAVAIGHHVALAIEEDRYYAALLQAERLAAVGTTIAGLSHHIKNIMQGVRFGSDLVRDGLKADDREALVRGWALVEKNQARIDELILDMLNLSKEREPSLEPVPLASIANEVVEILAGQAATDAVSLSLEPSEITPVLCDPAGIQRALLNVAGNAVDAVRTVTAGAVIIAIQDGDGAVEIRVTDNGPGVPVELREEIFRPFVSTKGSRGTGLGLPSARKTLREHGGDLFVREAPGGGAQFVLCIPRGG